MDSIYDIALSHVADIFSTDKLYTLSLDMWSKIYHHSGQSHLYTEYKRKITPLKEPYGYGLFDYYIVPNEYCYSALLDSLNTLRSTDEKAFVFFLKNCISQINLNKAINKESANNVLKDIPKYRCDNFESIIYDKTYDDKLINKLLSTCPSSSYIILNNNLHIIGYDIEYINDEFSIFPYFDDITNNTLPLIDEWLKNKSAKLFDEYQNANKSYSNSDYSGFLSHCRSLITGICSLNKEIGYKWYSGLAEICHFDKNIDNVTNYSKLGELSYNENSQDENQRYNYPRYKLIYRLYSFTSDLGSHVTEGNMTQERTIEHEETYSSDALMGLRMTQSFLLWIYQNEDYDSI